MSLVHDLLGCPLQMIDRPYWAVKINDTGSVRKDWVSEAHWKVDLYNGTRRLTDWTRDLVENELTGSIRELWMFCPANPLSPLGNTACLPIVEPYTAFQTKVGYFDTNIVMGQKTPCAMLIGRVDDRASGACIVFVWDHARQVLIEPIKTSQRELESLIGRGMGHATWNGNIIKGLGTWKPGSVAPIGPLAVDVLGVRL